MNEPETLWGVPIVVVEDEELLAAMEAAHIPYFLWNGEEIAIVKHPSDNSQ